MSTISFEKDTAAEAAAAITVIIGVLVVIQFDYI